MPGGATGHDLTGAGYSARPQLARPATVHPRRAGSWAGPAGRNQRPAGRNQRSGTSTTRVPQFCLPSVVWLDLAGMYSVASHAASDPVAGTAKE